MWLNLLVYGLLVAALVVLVWLTGRLLGVPPVRRPDGALSVNPWVDAECAFDRALAGHRRDRLAAALTRRTDRLRMPSIDEVAPFVRLRHLPVGEQVVPLRAVVGSADPAGGVFDREFRPTGQRARDRFQRVFVAMRRGQELPPVEVFRWNGSYYVVDGHHRVAAARAMGLEFLACDVTDLD